MILVEAQTEVKIDQPIEATFDKQTQAKLSDKHLHDLTEKRQLPTKWVLENCRSLTTEKATKTLGYTAKSAGILIQGDGWQEQFKPDRPWLSDKDKSTKKKQAPKYRTPKNADEDYDAILPSHPENKSYWQDLDALKQKCWQIDGHPYLLITEGGFKAIMGCAYNIPTIGLLGVEMGLTSAKKDPQSKRYLVPSLEKFAKAGFGFIIAFDADCAENKFVAWAEKKLSQQLEKFNIPVLSITGLWNIEDGKGMDDYIQNQGIEEFRKILNQAFNREESKKQDSENSPKQEKPKKAELPPVSETAALLAEKYRSILAWESEYQLWRHYGAQHDGMWSEESPESVRGIIHAHLRSIPDSPGFNAGYVSSVVTILQSDLEVKEWNEQQGLIPLRDGVLDQVTLELKPHSPGFRFTWQLPFSWTDRGVGCDPIEEFLLKITGNQQIAEVLLCYLSAIVTRRSDLQRYLELIGGGGTGKSTFMVLAKSLTGEKNTVSSQLKLLESNQFETAKFYRKLLVLFPDSERWQGEVSVLKQLTGQDPMRYERKGIQQCKDYVYQGMVILSANEAPESSDRTSGQERRKLTIGLDNRIPEYEGRNLAEEFQPYLPGLLKRVLEIPRQRVTDLIKHTEKNVPALAEKKWAQLIETNPIAAWVDDAVIVNPEAKGYIGKDDPEQLGRWLYANFCQYQRTSGHRGFLPVKRFSSNLRDLLKNQMKVSVQEGRDRNGAYIQGIGLRCFYDPNGTEYQRPITKGNCDASEGECDGFEGKCDGYVTDETLASVGCDGCDGFLENREILEKSNEFSVIDNNQFAVECVGEIAKIAKNQVADKCLEESEKNPSHPSHPSPASIPTITNPSQDEVNPSPSLRLAALLRMAECWAEVEAVVNATPELKTEAWNHLTADEKNRLLDLKDDYLLEPLSTQETHSEGQTTTSSIDLMVGAAVGHWVRTRSLSGELSSELFVATQWNEPNGFYVLSNGDSCYPTQLELAE